MGKDECTLTYFLLWDMLFVQGLKAGLCVNGRVRWETLSPTTWGFISNCPRPPGIQSAWYKHGPPTCQQNLGWSSEWFPAQLWGEEMDPWNQVWAESAPLSRRIDLLPSSSSIGPSPKLSPEAHLALFSRKQLLWASLPLPHFLPFRKYLWLQPLFSPPLIQPHQIIYILSAFNLLQSIMLSVSSSASFDVTLHFIGCLQLHSYPY